MLVINAGSSSLKFALVEPVTGDQPLHGIAERLGTPEADLRVNGGASEPIGGASHELVVRRVLELVGNRGFSERLLGAGHRIVHGGARFSASVRVDGHVLDVIRSLIPLAPLHNPPGLAGLEAVTAALPDLPQVAVFDTAFHHGMPAVAYRYAVPEEWYRDHGVRRYGFHGISHRYVSGRAAELLGRPLDQVRLVSAHLGNGCSAAAVRDGRSVDTTMGLTPLEGLVMGTRSGDVDPGVFAYLADVAELDVHQVTDALNQRSGLAALSGISNDMRAVVDAAERGDEGAKLAVDVFVHRLAKAVAGLVTNLGRLDVLVFTGGIGEHSALVRARVLEQLGFMGLTLAAAANDDHGDRTGGRITEPGTRPVALVVPTNEELLIARDTVAVVQGA